MYEGLADVLLQPVAQLLLQSGRQRQRCGAHADLSVVNPSSCRKL